jgi:hypothetical protein
MRQLGPEGRALSRAESSRETGGQIGERKGFSSPVEFLSMRRVNKRYEKQFIENHRGGVCRSQSALGGRARG